MATSIRKDAGSSSPSSAGPAISATRGSHRLPSSVWQRKRPQLAPLRHPALRRALCRSFCRTPRVTREVMKARRAGAALAMLASTCTRGDSTRAEPEVGIKTRDTSLATEPSHAARSEQRTLPFEWRPPEGDPETYAMPESADRHQLVVT